MSTDPYPGEKTAHLALPLRWNLLGQDNRASTATACTYDIMDQLYCTKACNQDSDCPSVLPTCIQLTSGIGMGSYCGPG